MSVEFQLKNIKVKWRNPDFTLSIPDLHFASGDETGMTTGTCVGNMLPIIGRTGEGKSTLLYTLALLKFSDKGDWRFFNGEKDFIQDKNEKICRADIRFLRFKEFGFAYQSNTLAEPLTVGDNLSYPLWLQGHTSGKAKKIAKQAIEKVLIASDPDPDKFLARYPETLSGGQRQRAALAQAWIHNPKVFFADEPTGSLDPETRKEIIGKICDWLNEKKDRLFIWVTHHERVLESESITHYIEVNNQQATLNKNS